MSKGFDRVFKAFGILCCLCYLGSVFGVHSILNERGQAIAKQWPEENPQSSPSAPSATSLTSLVVNIGGRTR